YWRVLLLVGLLLPLCQPRHIVRAPTGVAARVITTAAAIDVPDSPRSATPSRPWFSSDRVLVLLGAGVAARALCLPIAALPLAPAACRRPPRGPGRVPEPMRLAFERIGADVGLYLSDRITGPVAFGFRRPVVLLPSSALSLAPHVQEAIAYHELVHVRRHDWL